jgi:hypothetical protein
LLAVAELETWTFLHQAGRFDAEHAGPGHALGQPFT